MKHTSTRLIFDHWNRQRGARSAPTRSEIEPAAIRHALGDTFMLAADFIDGIRFRLAGTRVCALFGREIKGERFHALWSEASRAQIANIGNAAVNEAVVPSPVLLDGPKRVQKPNWNCCCCRLAMMDARGFALLVRWRPWPSLIGSAKSPSWSWNCRHCAMSAPRNPTSRYRNFEAAPACACGMAFWSIAAGAKSGRATA